jgi:hypothetical protein
VQIGSVQRLGKLPGIHRRRADVAGFASPHHVVQRLQRLFDWGVVVPAVDLVQIDVVGSQALETGVDRAEDVFAGQAALVGARAHLEKYFGRQYHLVARGEITQRFADDLLAAPIRVDIRGVKEVDA